MCHCPQDVVSSTCFFFSALRASNRLNAFFLALFVWCRCRLSLSFNNLSLSAVNKRQALTKFYKLACNNNQPILGHVKLAGVFLCNPFVYRHDIILSNCIHFSETLINSTSPSRSTEFMFSLRLFHRINEEKHHEFKQWEYQPNRFLFHHTRESWFVTELCQTFVDGAVIILIFGDNEFQYFP